MSNVRKKSLGDFAKHLLQVPIQRQTRVSYSWKV